MDIRIAGKFRLGRKIGGGSFGDIYLGAWSYSAFGAQLFYHKLFARPFSTAACAGIRCSDCSRSVRARLPAQLVDTQVAFVALKASKGLPHMIDSQNESSGTARVLGSE
jgi:hypothetical protein